MDSRRLTRWFVLAGACIASVARAEPSAPVPAPAPAAEPGTELECASVTASVRLQAYGYAHVVTLANHCQRSVSCEVWTNVDPSPHLSLSAKPGQTAETVTRSGSPSRDVQAGKLCRFAAEG